MKAVRKTIAALPGGYAEAADWLDVTENALFNRLRADGDQIFPLGWAMILQRAGGTHFIADAVAQSANGVFVSLPDVEDVDNADIARLEAEGWLTRKARRQGNRNASNVYQLNVAKLQATAFSQLSDSDPSKSDASKSDPSKFDASKSGKKAGFHQSESGGDPSVKSKHDPSDKKTSRPDASQPDTQKAEQDFLTRHPDAAVFSPKKRQWGTQDDLTCAQWLWKKIIALYEHAAECDGEVVRPKEPNWTAWANEIRLMCVQDGRTHKQICEMYSRVSRDPFWCRNVLSPSKLREKWDELSLRLSPSVSTYTEKREDPYFKASYDNVDYSQIPAGFRG